jgi:phosphate starvation-inducible PhoH-like protein
LIDALDVLRGVEGISFVHFNERDVVRHTLVQRIVKAYERYTEMTGSGRQLSLKLGDLTPESESDATVDENDPSASAVRRAEDAAE